MLFCYSLTNNNTITPILYIGRLKEKENEQNENNGLSTLPRIS